MRMIGMSVLAVLASFAFAVQSSANSQAYCELFAKDLADGRTTDIDLWQISYRNAFNDCMNQYTAAAPAAAPKKQLQKQASVPLAAPETSEKAAAVVKPKLKLEPGTEAWNEYCAAKYKSFSPDTGNYMSHTGKERRCIVTQ
jgi:BA14K-like protein